MLAFESGFPCCMDCPSSNDLGSPLGHVSCLPGVSSSKGECGQPRGNDPTVQPAQETEVLMGGCERSNQLVAESLAKTMPAMQLVQYKISPLAKNPCSWSNKRYASPPPNPCSWSSKSYPSPNPCNWSNKRYPPLKKINAAGPIKNIPPLPQIHIASSIKDIPPTMHD